MEATKALFLEELRAKGSDVAEQVEQWREGRTTNEQLIKRLYSLTHTLKGVALTVGFADVHDVAERVSAFKYRQESCPLSAAELNEAADAALELRKYI
ncbi:Hpt domain-containing protein [Paenibacillus sp. TRM 82003]|nr:Hpt domain-containing protein [Paenibacillus sp. TRM 82003]